MISICLDFILKTSELTVKVILIYKICDKMRPPQYKNVIYIVFVYKLARCSSEGMKDEYAS